MNFLKLAAKRSSVRHYQQRPIDAEKLNRVLEAGRIAPSACNKQPWRYIIVETEQGLSKLNECGKIFDAPTAIIVCGDHNLSWKRPQDGKDHCDIDVSISIDHMTLAAAEEGLGTCWVCWFDPALCKELFNIPEHLEPIALLPIGYPAKEKHANRHDHERIAVDSLIIDRV